MDPKTEDELADQVEQEDPEAEAEDEEDPGEVDPYTPEKVRALVAAGLRLGKKRVLVQPIRSISVRYELRAAFKRNRIRAAFAALGLCWPWLGKKVARGQQVPDDLVAFGLSVSDFLLDPKAEHGIQASYQQMIYTAQLLWMWSVMDLVTEREVQAAANFSRPQPGASTG